MSEKVGVQLTHAQSMNRLKDIQEEVQRLHDKQDKTPEDDSRVRSLKTEFDQVNRHRLDLEHDQALAEVRSALANGAVSTEPGSVDDTPEQEGRFSGVNVNTGKFRNPFDLAEVRSYGRSPQQVTAELRARALDGIERMPAATEATRNTVASMVETMPAGISEQVLRTSSPAYVEAFGRLLRTQGNMSMLSTEDHRILGEASRAMSLTDANGGYLVPFHLDPSVILTADGSLSEMRSIARVVQTTSDTWNGITSAGVTGSWDAEAAEVSDDAPTFAPAAIPVYKGSIFVPISYEALSDEVGVASEVAKMMAAEKARMESVAFVTGTGVGQPTGIVTALTGTASVIASTTADSFKVEDLAKVMGSLPARYRLAGKWLMNPQIHDLTFAFSTQIEVADANKRTLRGYPVAYAEAMDGSLTAAAANPIAIFGDFSNYVIVDRIGTSIRWVSDLFGANRRPTDQGGWFASFRVGADSVNDAAFRMLDA